MSGSTSINISPQTPVFTGNALSMAFVVGPTPIESFDLAIAFDPAVLNAATLGITSIASGWNILLNVVGSSISISGFAGNLTTLATGSNIFRLTGNLQAGASRDLYLDISGSYNDPAVTIPVTEFSFLNSAPTGQVVVSGTPTQGQTLTANASALADADGLGAFSYQWQADGTDIANATGTSLVLTQSEVGRAVRVVVRYVDGRGVSESVTSSASAAVANVNDPLTGALTIDGALVQGQTLTANTSALADIDGLGAFSYQWRANGVAITGATGHSFTLTQDQVGANISVVVSYTDLQGTPESITSAATVAVLNVNDAPSGAVTISGLARQGQTLSLDASGLSDPDGLGPFTYQWQANGVNIVGATGSSLTLAQAQVGQAIRALVRYTDGFGQTETVISAATEPVANVNDLGGLIYHWKSHALLGSVQLSTLSREATQADPAPAVFDLRAVAAEHIPGSGQARVTVQVWANVTAGDANFDFRVHTTGAQAATFTSSLGGSWTVLANTANPDEIAIGGFDSGAGLSAGPVQIGTLQFDYSASTARADLGFRQISVGDIAVADRGLAVIGASSDASGQWSVIEIPNDAYSVLASRSVADVGNAVTSADALAALRIAVSLNPNTDPDGSGPASPLRVSPYQFMAADVNGSNSVTSADALAILRMAVKLPTALPHEWFFVDESRDFWNEATSQYTLTRTATIVERAIPVNVVGDTTLNLVGVLKGDVNGSWTPPAGSLDLDLFDPNYFTQLASRMGVPTDQWGL
jgi:hypothetical protein